VMARTGRPFRALPPPGLSGSLPEREGGRRGPWTPLLYQRLGVTDDADADADTRAPPPRYADSLAGSINGPPAASPSDSDIAAEQMTAAELVLIEGDPPSYHEALAEE
jgi:hypothetical protein